MPATRFLALVVALALLPPSLAQSQDKPLAALSPAERDAWIALGTRIHGGFGSLIALGIRIGEDARQHLNASPRELDVTYLSGKAAPCPCVADGIMIATGASPGQQTLRVAEKSAGEGEFGRVILRQVKTGATLEYVIPQKSAPAILAANRGTPEERWAAIMAMPESDAFTRRALAPSGEKKP